MPVSNPNGKQKFEEVLCISKKFKGTLQKQIVILNKVKDLPVTEANRYLEILRYAQKDRIEGFAKTS